MILIWAKRCDGGRLWELPALTLFRDTETTILPPVAAPASRQRRMKMETMLVQNPIDDGPYRRLPSEPVWASITG